MMSMGHVLNTKPNYQYPEGSSRPFFKKKVLCSEHAPVESTSFFRAGGLPSVQLQPVQAPTSIEEKELQAKRFQNDFILKSVINNQLILKKGKRGAQIDVAVAKIQRALIDAGFAVRQFGPDGIYGSETESIVKEFQSSENLPPEQQDGKVGPITLGLLDEHFENRTTPGLIPSGIGTINLEFFSGPLSPRYSNPDPFVDIHEGSIRLNGPSFSFLACVTTTGNDTNEAKKWEAGHIQDVTDTDIFGTYSNNKRQAFVVALPIRDAVPEGQLFPWYNANVIKPVETGQSVCASHSDDPAARFPPQDGNAVLQSINMKFKAIDWFVVRNRNTGEINFLDHAEWGFDLNVTFDPANMPAVNAPPDEGVVVTSESPFPVPEGNIDPIQVTRGKGSTNPSMTEGVFNEEARLVKS
jgi:peptidoglycan hydrolase-like protein with peptidoglycan-binding domain